MMSRVPSAWIDCADYSDGTLTLTVDQWACDIYGLFIAKKVDLNPNATIDGSRFFFNLSSNSIQDEIFEIKGIEYQMVAGLFVDKQFGALVGKDNFQTFPPQTRFETNQYEISMDWDYLHEVLNDHECLIMTSIAWESLGDRHQLSLNDGIQVGHNFFSEATRIGLENGEPTIYNDRFEEDGICKHKLNQQSGNTALTLEPENVYEQPVEANLKGDISEPLSDSVIFFSIAIVLLGIFFILLRQKLRKQNSGE